MAVTDIRIWTGTTWESVKGAKGDPGPTAVSADAGNASRIGTDGKVYTPLGISQTDADSRYVNITGDTMTGPLTVATKLSVDTTGGVGIAEIASLPVFAAGASGPVLTLENETTGRAAIRLGTSATATNNIFIDSVGDGRLALRTGNVGAIPEQLIAVIGKSSVGWNTDSFNVATASGAAVASISRSATAFSTDSFAVNTAAGDAVANIAASSTGFRTDSFGVTTASGAAVASISRSATAFSTDSFAVNTAAGDAVANIAASSTGFRTDSFGVTTASGAAVASISRSATAFSTDSFAVNTDSFTVNTAGGNFIGTFRDRSFSVGVLLPLTESAAAQIAVVGKDLGGLPASSASTLAQSNTRSTVSIRPSPFSGYTLSIGAEATHNAPYIQGVTNNGGTSAGPVSINPFGGNIGIGCIPTTAGVAAEVGGDLLIRGAVNCSGSITSTGTAHAFAPNSIPGSAIVGNTPQTIASASATGSAGQLAWDENFLYIRTATGWKKAALAAV